MPFLSFFFFLGDAVQCKYFEYKLCLEVSCSLGAYGFSICEYGTYLVVRFFSVDMIQKGSGASCKGK